MTFKLQYKKWMKAVDIIVGIGGYISIVGEVLGLITELLTPFIGNLFTGLLTIVVIASVVGFCGYIITAIKHKVVVNVNANNIKVYSLSTIFWRCTYIDEINNIMVEKNSDLKYTWIYENAVIVIMTTHRHRVKFPLSQADYEQFSKIYKISEKIAGK